MSPAHELTMQLWVELNGLVSLCISRLIREVYEKQQQFIESYLILLHAGTCRLKCRMKLFTKEV
jgi:hypothetical protein